MAQNERKKTINMPTPTPAPKPLEQTQPTFEQLKEQRFQIFSGEWLRSHIYTVALPENVQREQFETWVSSMFRHYSDAGLKMPTQAYLKIVSTTSWTYEQFDIIMQILYMANANQLGITMPEYVAFKNSLDGIKNPFLDAINNAQELMKKEFDEMESVVDENSHTIPVAYEAGQA